MSDSIVIIPTYNEKENIEKIIRAVFGLEKQFDILVIDDGSPDGTAAIVKGLMAKEFAGRLHILERSGKLGLGTAYIMGFKWSLKQGYDFIFEMDADFSHDPNDLPRLYAATHDEGYDVAVGSRYISGVNVVNWPIGRVLMSYFASKYVRIVTGFKVHDTTAGFVCYRRKVLETIDLDAIRFKGYAFQIEMKYTAHRIGFKIKEVPVIFVNRREGVSKMSGGIFGEAFFPRECVRLRMPGAGENYVHGGISLQEMCVPVVRFCNHRAGSRGFVATADATLSAVAVPSAVANPSFTVDLLQNEAVSGKVLPAEYEIYVEDASGRVVSGRSRVFADIDSTDASKRVVKARVDLLTSVAFNALETYFLVARNIRIGDADTLGELRIHLA